MILHFVLAIRSVLVLFVNQVDDTFVILMQALSRFMSGRDR